MSESKGRILVVDDEPVIRLFLQELLEDEGFEVVTGQTVAEGLERLNEGGLNLVITDKNLPDGTGFEMVHAAKGLNPPCEAMIITGYASLDSAVMALQIGAYDYILKPIEDVDLLLEKARKAIEKQRIWAELAVLRAQGAGAPCSTCAASAAQAAAPAASPLAGLSNDVPQLMKLAEMGSLIPMLAHEMRQPLAGIKGYVDLILHKRELEPGIRAKLVAVQEQVVHVAGLVDSLTSHSRVSASGLTPVDLHRPIDTALSIFPVLQGGGRYDFTRDIESSLPPVQGNGSGIQQVIINLVKNAKDALDEVGGGRLLVKAWHDNETGRVKVRVEDSGPGIASLTREHLFEPFFTTKQEGVGTGLGLTICQQIMAEHGGTIEVESPLDASGGTAFTLSFPTAREAILAGSGTRSGRS